MSALIDSSVWIAHLRAPRPGLAPSLEGVQQRYGRLVTCEPVAMELLAGARGAEIAVVEALVDGLAQLPLEPLVDFRTAASLYRDARPAGHTIRSLVDCLIAAVALRHDATVVHVDRDFELLALVSPLRVERCD